MSSTSAELSEPATSTSASRDDQVHRRPGERDRELAQRRIGHAPEACDAADRQQGDVLRLDAEAARRQDVAELVRVTQMKMSTMNTTLSSAASGPLDCHAATAIQTRKIAKVT